MKRNENRIFIFSYKIEKGRIKKILMGDFFQKQKMGGNKL